jgi:hypothetical protein
LRYRARNGIKVNGERVETKFLHPGDIISIAKNHFAIQYEPSGAAPPQEEDPFAMSLLAKAGLEKRPEKRSAKLPPSAKTSPIREEFSADEDAAMDWLMGDS